MASTYLAKGVGVPFAASQHMLTLWNPTGSGKLLKVYRVWVGNNSQAVAVTGVAITLALYRTTTHSGGIPVIPLPYDSTNTALGTVVASSKSTSTVGSLFRKILYSNDDPVVMSGTIDEWQQYLAMNMIWHSGRLTAIDPIVIRENTGLTLQNTTSSTVSFLDTYFEFTVE